MIDDSILRAFLTLAFVVALTGGAAFSLKKFVFSRKKTDGESYIKPLAKISLQPKTHLFVVEADGKRLLVGSTEKSVNLVADLTDSKQEEEAVRKYLSEHENPADAENAAIELNVPARKMAKRGFPEQKTAKKPELAGQSLSFKNFLMSSLKKSEN